MKRREPINGAPAAGPPVRAPGALPSGPSGGRTPAAETIATAIAVLLLVLLAVVQLWPGLSAGLSPPISWDHGSHLGKAILTAEHFLPWLRGWTDLVETGVPLNTVYTPTAVLWVLLFRVFTPFLAWHQTYALAFAGFRALVGLSVFRLSRVAGAGRFGALAAGVLALADQGTHSEGGWFYDVTFGVWPMSLAMCVLFFGVADLLVFVESGDRKARMRAMVLLGVALFSHQMCLIAVAMLLPVLVIVRATERGEVRQTLSRSLPVLVVAGMLAAWWMLPMLGLSAWLDDHGQLYASSVDVGERMVRAEGVLSGGAWTGVLVSLAIGTSLFARGPRRFLALFAILATLVGTSGWFTQLDFARWLPALGRIVFPRMMMIAKPVYFALAGVVVHDVAGRIAPGFRRILRTPGGIFALVLTAALVAPFTPNMLQQLGPLLFRREAVTTATSGEWADFQAAWQWVRELPDDQRASGDSRPDEDRFFRVAYLHDGTHLGQAAPAYTSVPGHTPGVLVGEAFRNTPDSDDPDALRAINVRYVVHFGALPGRLAAQCTRVESFGSAEVCELEGWSDELVSDGEGVVHPSITVREDTRLVFSPEGARTVIVRRALAPGWHAYADDVEIPIAEERVVDSPHLQLMRLAIPAETAHVELRYRNTGPLDVLGLLATLLGIAITIGATSRSARVVATVTRVESMVGRLRDRLPPRVVAHVGQHWPTYACVLPLLGVALVLGRNMSGHHFAYELSSMELSVARGAEVETCTDLAPDGEGRSCARAQEVVVQRTASVVDGRYHSCLTAHPTRGGIVRLAWSDVAVSGTLTLGAGISDETHAHGNGSPVLVRAIVDDETVSTLAVPNGRAWIERRARIEPGTHDIVFEIEAAEVARRELCFDAVVR
jgi:hypothetical protein